MAFTEIKFILSVSDEKKKIVTNGFVEEFTIRLLISTVIYRGFIRWYFFVQPIIHAKKVWKKSFVFKFFLRKVHWKKESGII